VAKNGLLRVVSCSLSGGGEDERLAMAHVRVRLCIIGDGSVLAVVTRDSLLTDLEGLEGRWWSC
jgi:hypothetical protein